MAMHSDVSRGVPIASIATLAEMKDVRIIQKLLDSDLKASAATAQAKPLKDDTVLRFLRFTSGDTARSLELLRPHVAWRKQYAHILAGASIHADKDRSMQPSPLLQKYLSYTFKDFVGVDKAGFPVAVIRGGTADPVGLSKMCTASEVLEAGIWTQERMQSALAKFAAMSGKARHQVTLIIDLEGIGMRFGSLAAITAVSQYMKMSVANYPEEFRRVFLIRAPSIFPMLFGAVKGLIPAKDRAIVNVFGCHNYLEALREQIDDSQIPAYLGGSLALSGDSEAYIRPGGLVPVEKVLQPPVADSIRICPPQIQDAVCTLSWAVPQVAIELGVKVGFEVAYCGSGYFTSWHSLPVVKSNQTSKRMTVHFSQRDLTEPDDTYHFRIRAVTENTGVVGPWLKINGGYKTPSPSQLAEHQRSGFAMQQGTYVIANA